MIKDDKPAEEEGRKGFEDEHVRGFCVCASEQGLDIGDDGPDEGNGRTEPENLSGHAGGNHEGLRLGLVLIDLISLRDKGLILLCVFSDKIPAVILDETADLR